jgi:hypothetical protein
MTKLQLKECEGTFDLVHSPMALPRVITNPLDKIVKNLVAFVKLGGCLQLVKWSEMSRRLVKKDVFSTISAVKDLFSIVSGGQGVDLHEKIILPRKRGWRTSPTKFSPLRRARQREDPHVRDYHRRKNDDQNSVSQTAYCASNLM